MSMILLKVGLVMLPFYELLIRLLPYSAANTPDTRVAKCFLGMWFALAIGFCAIYNGEMKKSRNIWLFLFVLYLPLSIHLASKFSLVMNGIESNNFWVWKPLVAIIGFYLMFLAVQSLNITKQSFRSLLNIAVWCGAVMSGYVFLQALGFDQFFQIKDGPDFWAVTQRAVVGNLGQSTVVASYLAVLVPLALYLKRYYSTAALICAVLLTQSAMAIGAMIVSLMVFACLKQRIMTIPIIAATLVAIACVTIVPLSIIKVKNPEKAEKIIESVLSDNGRSNVWKGSIDVLKNHKFGEEPGATYPYTGIGLGSYSLIIRPIIKTHFAQAHNEYIELACTVGIIGLLLFLASIFFMFRGISLNAETISLSSSFICVALIAGGTFVWHLSPHNYYTVMIVGLLHNQSILKGELQ